jgi:threonine dehydrogenase-like Zn-dependent dehydrogenase
MTATGITRLTFDRKPVRFAAARLAGAIMPGRGAVVGPLTIESGVRSPQPPTDEWHVLTPRLAGICGSDLALIDGTAPAYFDPLVSYPFTPGHEVVGDVTASDGSTRRVALIPVLHCATRGITPLCHQCSEGRTNLCERTAFGHLSSGLQSGFCEDTGGAWSTAMLAHDSQLFDVPDALSDEAAVLLEPTACAAHAAARYRGEETVIIGAGTLGLLTLACITALRDRDRSGPIVVTARYPEQKRLAKELGADIVCSSDELPRVVRSASKSLVIGDQLTCGFDHVVDCVGSSDTLQQALQVVAPGGEVQVVGMPGNVTLELTSLWHRESSLRGCYAYTRADFATAAEVIARFDLGRLVSATYPLADYTDAIAHAAAAGRRGAVKIAFDMRDHR